MQPYGTRYPRHARRTIWGESPIAYKKPPIKVNLATLLVNNGGAALRNNEGSLLYRA